MSSSNKTRYIYLNRGDMSSDMNLFMSKLAAEIKKSQPKAPPSQWKSFIKGLTSKGVKTQEIEDSEIMGWLEGSQEKSITKDEIIDWLNRHLPVIKEVPLSKHAYAGLHQPGHDSYHEVLLLLASQQEVVSDILEELLFELQEFEFEPERMIEEPEKVIELSNRITAMTHKKNVAKGHRVSHFNSVNDPDTGKEIVNMIAHMRYTIRGDMLFIEEIQSDWAQRGRKNDWKNIPQGPFVTNTELWSGLVLRRLLQRAAQNENIKRVAWIRGFMRNGGDGQGYNGDGLDDFYMKILPKIADKLLSGTGEKIKMTEQTFADRKFEVPTLEITEDVRKKLSQAQVLYSRDVSEILVPSRTEAEVRRLSLQLKRAQEMLGSSVAIRLANKVFDAATAEEVAGRQIGNLIEVSMNARNPSMTASHEVWHYAYENLIGPMDQRAIDRAFAVGGRLNTDVRAALVKEGATAEAIAQCDDPREAAAHGYALWTEGKIFLSRTEENRKENIENGSFGAVGRVFRAVEGAFLSLGNWMRRVCFESGSSKDVHRTSDIFEMLNAGRYRKDQVPEMNPNSATFDEPTVLRYRHRTA